jgi:pyrroline-5-carboxylate reductase
MNILVIGCGNMGGAMLSAWLRSGVISRASVVDHSVLELRARYMDHHHQLDWYPELSDIKDFTGFDIALLAVKPQQMAEVLAQLKGHLRPTTLVMTIAAGLRLSFYARSLGNPIIRIMPNTPVMVGRGMTVGVRAGTSAHQATVEKLMQTTGDFLWVENEQMLDVAMALQATGPACHFYFTELMAEAGVVHGLSPEVSNRLARQTLIGAGALAAAREDSLAKLRENVTSKGGVTEATLNLWNQGDAMRALVTAGVEANIRRAAELAGKS